MNTLPVTSTTPVKAPVVTQMSPQEDRSMRELVAKLADDSSRLLRTETELAKREFKDKIDDVQEKVLHATIGGAVLYAGALGVLAGVILLLGLAIPYWLSALAVGALTAIAGVVMLKSAQKKEINLKPERTISNVRRDAYVMKEAAR